MVRVENKEMQTVNINLNECTNSKILYLFYIQSECERIIQNSCDFFNEILSFTPDVKKKIL